MHPQQQQQQYLPAQTTAGTSASAGRRSDIHVALTQHTASSSSSSTSTIHPLTVNLHEAEMSSGGYIDNGCESPTNITASEMRRMSLTHQGWGVQTTPAAQPTQVQGAHQPRPHSANTSLSASSSFSYNYTPQKLTASSSSSSSAAASPTHLKATYAYHLPAHSQSHSQSQSQSQSQQHSRNSSSSSATSCFTLLSSPRSPPTKSRPSDVQPLVMKELYELQHQHLGLVRSVSAPELEPEGTTAKQAPQTLVQQQQQQIQTPIVTQVAYQYQHPPYLHQLPVQLLNHPTAIHHHPHASSGSSSSAHHHHHHSSGLHSASVPPLTRDGSLEERENSSTLTTATNSARALQSSSEFSSACSSANASNGGSPNRGFMSLSNSSIMADNNNSRGQSRAETYPLPQTNNTNYASLDSGLNRAQLQLPQHHLGGSHGNLVSFAATSSSSTSSTHQPLMGTPEHHIIDDTTSEPAYCISPESLSQVSAPGSTESRPTVGSIGSEHGTSPVRPSSSNSSAPGSSNSSSRKTSTSSGTRAQRKRCRQQLARDGDEDEDEVRQTQVQTQAKLSAESSASSAQGVARQAAAAAAESGEIKKEDVSQLTQPNQQVKRAISAPPMQADMSAPVKQQPPPAAAAAVATSSSSASHHAPSNSAAAQSLVASSLAPNTLKRRALISTLSCVLTQLFSNPNDRLPTDSRLLTRFHTLTLPMISIGKYLDRIAYYSECSDEVLVMAFIHISRISHNSPQFHLNALSIHRLLLTSIMCTTKFFDDQYFNNSFYAKVGGVVLKEMNHLELEFLELIQFELHIDSKVYCRFYEELRNHVLHPNCSCHYREMVDLNMEEIENPPQI